MDKKEIFDIQKSLMIFKKTLDCKMADKIDDKNFKLSNFMVIAQLMDGESKSLKEISGNIGFPNSTTSVIVDKMVKEDMLIRETDEQDRRKVLIKITDKAKEKIKEVNEKYIETFMEILSSATEEEVQTIFKGFKTLSSVVEKEKGPDPWK